MCCLVLSGLLRASDADSDLPRYTRRGTSIFLILDYPQFGVYFVPWQRSCQVLAVLRELSFRGAVGRDPRDPHCSVALPRGEQNEERRDSHVSTSATLWCDSFATADRSAPEFAGASSGQITLDWEPSPLETQV